MLNRKNEILQIIKDGFFLFVLIHRSNRYPAIVHNNIVLFRARPNKKKVDSKAGIGSPWGSTINT